MDILIKGMEMKDYPQSITINPDGSVVKDTFGLHRPMDEWKAVALPEHGRLGELDKIAERFHGFYEKHLENGNYETAEIWKYAEQEVRLQGTIVEATE